MHKFSEEQVIMTHSLILLIHHKLIKKITKFDYKFKQMTF